LGSPLERADKAALAVRAARVRWLAKVIPRGGFGMPLETYYVFEEAKTSFVYGNFVAAIVLAAAFVEHWFAGSLGSRDHAKEAARGLAACTKLARAKKFVDSVLLDKVDQLRLIRNPFVHLKSLDHEHIIGRRLAEQKIHPEELLENDAKEALTVMYGVVVYSFR
jgi:hypothetical protein